MFDPLRTRYSSKIHATPEPTSETTHASGMLIAFKTYILE